MNTYLELTEKFERKDVVVGIYGLGYVGVPLLLNYSRCGYKVIGIDVDKNKVDMLNQGKSTINYIEDCEIQKSIVNGTTFTNDYSKSREVDAFIICVPTPLKKEDQKPDLSYIESVARGIDPFIEKGKVISLESTTYPGTTNEILISAVLDKKLVIGSDIFIAYSPEREDPGNKSIESSKIPKIIGASTKKCLSIATSLYRDVYDNLVPMSSVKAAEFTKLFENSYRAVNIGFVNEMKVLADKLGLDINEIISAASTKPFGYKPFYPGPGIGGHCIPIDPHYLIWHANNIDCNLDILQTSCSINQSMPNWVCSKVEKHYLDNNIKINDLRLLVVGVAYKKDIDDIRESPSIEIIDELEKKSFKVDYHDPHVPCIENKSGVYKSIKLSKKSLLTYKGIIICTNHGDVDYNLLQKSLITIFDTRNTYKKYYNNVIQI